MQRQVYNIWTNRLILPKRLWFLLKQFWKPVDRTFEQNLGNNTKYLYYLKDQEISIDKKVSIVYWSFEKAKEIQKQNNWIYIMEELEKKGTTWEKYSKENEELKKENEELKSLPPIEIERIENKFDDPQDENLTNPRKRGRSNWEK